jgi:hypothetical protein
MKNIPGQKKKNSEIKIFDMRYARYYLVQLRISSIESLSIVSQETSHTLAQSYQSKPPYLYTLTLDNMSYLQRITGCCLKELNSVVDYFTHPDNVKILGFHKVCGDEVITPPETCDGPIINETCSNYVTCTGGTVLRGSLSCSSDCLTIDTTECTCNQPSAYQEPYTTD